MLTGALHEPAKQAGSGRSETQATAMLLLSNSTKHSKTRAYLLIYFFFFKFLYSGTEKRERQDRESSHLLAYFPNAQVAGARITIHVSLVGG